MYVLTEECNSIMSCLIKTVNKTYLSFAILSVISLEDDIDIWIKNSKSQNKKK